MPQDNKIKELIINQLTKEQYKELKDNNQLSNTELYIITNNANYTEEEILTLLSSKQNKLTAGDGVTIEGDTITINLDDFYTSNAIDELLKNKSNVSDAGHSLDYTDNILTLQDINGNELSSVRIIYNPEVDNVTINLSNTNQLQSIGEMTRNGIPKYTWIGTEEEYEQAKLNGVITEFTEILITDSEAEIVSPIVQYNAPTKISDLANDMNFVSNDDLQSVKSDLENKINTGIDDTNLVHKDGNETIDGFKKFKQKITIENSMSSARIAHKQNNTSLEDGYIEFGENTLVYGKQNVQGELYDERNNIFHEGNLIAGNNIIITQSNGIYKINGQAGGESGGGGSSIANVDNDTIITREDGSISANGVLDQSREGFESIKFWSGTLEEYESLENIDDNMFYNITDDDIIIDSHRGGFEIGDIGIAPLGIDETKGKRRYLNGQLIIQDQYVKFTEKVKTAKELYPTLVCSEEEWQTISAMSVSGQCGKFVIDDNAGTIRLPKVVMPIQGLTDLSKLGEIVEAGLPNITGSFEADDTSRSTSTGAFSNSPSEAGTPNATFDNKRNAKFIFDASASNLIYGNSGTVQQEQIQYPYFIQVATGSETEDNITNERELVNPYVLLEPKFFETPVYNLSWLISNGSFTGSKAVHPHAYDALLIELNADIEVGATQNNYTKRGLPVKLATDSYTDYDFVVNPADETFRPPLKVNLASSKAVVGNGKAFGIINTNKPTEQATMIYYQSSDTNAYLTQVGMSIPAQGSPKNIGLNTNPTKSGIELSDSNLYLYFYVGEVAQNTNLVNAGRIEEKLVNKVDLSNTQWAVNACMPDYSAGVSVSYTNLNSGYEAPYDGVLLCNFALNGKITINSLSFSAQLDYPNRQLREIHLNKGDVVKTTTLNSTYGGDNMFFPLKGDSNA